MNVSQSVLKLISLEGKVAIISGAASGIGKGTAELLAEAGAHIAVLDIDKEKGKDTAAELKKTGKKAEFFKCDVTSDAECKKAVKAVFMTFGKIDILFNNAGISIRKNTVELKEEEWDIVLGVTLKGVYMLSHHVIPYMIENKGGSIINTGSGWSLKGGPDAVSYCAAKGGVLNLTRAMAIDHGKDNIRVNCVCPGDVDTPLLRGECRQLEEDIKEFMEEAADRPIRRVGTPEDVARAVLYFASDLSTWVPGANLVVDGGGIA